MDEVRLHLDHFHKDAVFRYGPLHRAGLLGLQCPWGGGGMYSSPQDVCVSPLCPGSSVALLDIGALRAGTPEQNGGHSTALKGTQCSFVQ